VAARQRYGDDPELTRATRAAVLHVAGALVVAVLAVALSFAFVFGKVLFFTHSFQLLRGWAGLALAGVVLLLTVRAFRRASRRARVPADARLVAADEPVAQQLARLSALADVPAPRLAEVTMGVRNAFVVETPGEPVTLCISRRAVEELPPEQLDAMLAHELFHVAHGDTALVRRLEHVARVVDDRAPSVVADFVLVGVRRMERQRELSADRAAALLTGAPGALVDALVACDPAPGDIPVRDLREALAAAFVAAPGASNGGLHDTHPTIGQRTEVLARAAAQLGRRRLTD
jgi:Zn-dependent protease with chaperone function